MRLEHPKWAAIAIGLTALVLSCSSAAAGSLKLDFASITSSMIVFDGSGNFSFSNGAGGNQFEITSLGDAQNDLGAVSGSFAIGAITSQFGVQTAPVTGTGSLVIHDGLGNDLNASVFWDTIATFGTGGTINVQGVLNLTSIAYSGPETQLEDLSIIGTASDVVTFQFTPAKPLSLLKNGPITRTSYSGSITTQSQPCPDGGSTAVLLGLALGCLGVFKYRR